MLQQKTKLTWYPAWLNDAVRVETTSSYPEVGGFQITTVEKHALDLLTNFGDLLPERGSVTIAWERASPSTTTPPESN